MARRLTKQAMKYIDYRHIYPPHGMEMDVPLAPHTHLWNVLEWETVCLTTEQRKAYYRMVIARNPQWHDAFWDMVEMRGEKVQFHHHGREDEGPQTELNVLVYKHYHDQLQHYAELTVKFAKTWLVFACAAILL